MKIVNIETTVQARTKLKDREKINDPIYSAAFEELDELRKKIALISGEVDASSIRFQKVTMQAVDEFVTVANEALSKFMHRTTEMKTTLDAIERAGRNTPALPAAPVAVPVIAPAPVIPGINQSLWWIIPVSIFCSILAGSAITYLILK